MPLPLRLLALLLESPYDFVLDAIVRPQFPLARLPEIAEGVVVHEVHLVQVVCLELVRESIALREREFVVANARLLLVLAVGGGVAGDAGQEAHENYEEEWQELPEDRHGVVLLGLALSVASLLVSVGLPVALARLFEETATEEHSENLVRINLLLELALAEAATSARRLHVAWLFACLVVHPTLLAVGEASIGCTNLLEGLVGLRRPVLVRVQLDGVLFVRFFDVLLRRCSLHAQDVVVVLLGQYLLTAFDLSRRILWCCWLLWLWRRLGLLS